MSKRKNKNSTPPSLTLKRNKFITVDTSPPLNAQVAFDIFQKLLKREDLDEDGTKKEFRSEILNYVLLHGIDKEYKKEIDKDDV